MKKLFTILFLAVAFITNSQAQQLDERATILTDEIARHVNMDETEYLKVKKYTAERLMQIDELANLPLQDERYLNLRLDKIEEEYNSRIFNTLDKKQFISFMKYKQKQPFHYSAVVQQKPYIAGAEEKE